MQKTLLPHKHLKNHGWQHMPGCEQGKSALENEIPPHSKVQATWSFPCHCRRDSRSFCKSLYPTASQDFHPWTLHFRLNLPQVLPVAEAGLTSPSFAGALGWKTPRGLSWVRQHLHGPAFGLVAADKKRFLRVGFPLTCAASLVQPPGCRSHLGCSVFTVLLLKHSFSS